MRTTGAAKAPGIRGSRPSPPVDETNLQRSTLSVHWRGSRVLAGTRRRITGASRELEGWRGYAKVNLNLSQPSEPAELTAWLFSFRKKVVGSRPLDSVPSS